jgi:hypothetical protein
MIYMRRDSSVNIVTRLDDRRNEFDSRQFSILLSAQTSSGACPISFIVATKGSVSAGAECVLLTTTVHPLQRLRMHGAIHSPICLHVLSSILVVLVILMGVEEVV